MGAAIAERKQAGLSLIELMIGLVLGVILIAGAISIYLASKRSYVEVEQVAALSENARFAKLIMEDSLRHAGFFGEISVAMVERDPNLTPVTDDCTGLASAHNLSQFVFAAHSDDATVKDCIEDAFDPNGIENDVLVIKHVLPRPYTDSPRPHDPTKDDGEINSPTKLQEEKTYVMTNNVEGRMFDGNDPPPDISAGGEMPNSSAWEYEYEVFYVRKDPDKDIPQLSRRFLEWNGAAMVLKTEDLAEGVENLRLIFGFDDDDDGEVDRYTNVDGVGSNWSQVDSVEVYILARSPTPDPQYTDEKTYHLGAIDDDSVKVTPNDNFRRLMVFTSVSLRNLKLIIRGGA